MTNPSQEIIPHSAFRIPHSPRCGAFTMVEMVVVVAIIVILVTLVAPAASTLWAERKQAQTENAIQGLLMSARARAVQSDGRESGFLVFLDEEGNQHLAPIERIHRDADIVHRVESCLPQNQRGVFGGLLDPLGQVAWQNIFVIRDEPDQVLPAPMRIIPRYAVDREGANPATRHLAFSDAELSNHDFANPPGDQAQRHRNFFSIVFSTSGELLINRDVLIMECNADHAETAAAGSKLGDRTNLAIGAASPYVSTYFSRDPNGPTGTETPIDIGASSNTFPNLIVAGDSQTTAINFASVDGLLVYDDAAFRELPDAEKRTLLERAARPIYIARYTGTVVRGPLGEKP